LRLPPCREPVNGYSKRARRVEGKLNGACSHDSAYQGQCFRDSVAVPNTGSSVYGLIVVKNATFGEVVSDRLFSVPQRPEVMSYDSDGLWHYTYDAKNRLVGMESMTVGSLDGYCIILDHVYDYMGRRSLRGGRPATGGPALMTKGLIRHIKREIMCL